jgi:hypothetical protein
LEVGWRKPFSDHLDNVSEVTLTQIKLNLLVEIASHFADPN